MVKRSGLAAVSRVALLALMLVGVVFTGCAPSGQQPKNVIVLIGDGMGPEQVRAAGMFANGRDGSLFMETLPHKGEVVTCPAYTVPADAAPSTVAATVTDSAAAATALATGHKVDRYVLSVAIPGDGKPLQTSLEQFAAHGKMTGLVTTSYLADATPAAFAAHVASRGMHREIVADYVARKVNVLLGGGDGDLAAEAVKAGGYQVVTDRKGLDAIVPQRGQHVLGNFGNGQMCYEYDYVTGVRKDYDSLPHLSEMAAAAIKVVSTEPRGFFLMIEGGCIDKACHPHQLARAIDETLEFDKTVKQVMAWASTRTDTLVIVVADHETGGLKVTANNGKGNLPTVTWSTGDHSGANVPLYAFGPGSEKVAGVPDNTDVYRLTTATFEKPTRYVPPTVQPASQPAMAPTSETTPACVLHCYP